MKDREIVKMAYQLILGREAESGSYDREFISIEQLRRDFLLSDEFLLSDIAKTIALKTKLEIIKNFEQLDSFVKKYQQGDYEGAEAQFLNSHVLDFKCFEDLFGKPRPNTDPFSDEYSRWEMSFFQFLSGGEYSFNSEGLDVSSYMDMPPTIYLNADTRIYHMHMYADFLNIAKPLAGMKVIEMGAGFGDLLELFGRCGCSVTGIEASKSYSEYIAQRLATQNIDAKSIHGSFYDIAQLDDIYNLILFESSFHHCGEPVRLLKLCHKKLSADGRIFFLNDAISPHYDCPWGVVRYDGETIMQIRMRGWLELGYRTDFFEQLLQRTGFKVDNIYTLHNNTMLYEVSKI